MPDDKAPAFQLVDRFRRDRPKEPQRTGIPFLADKSPTEHYVMDEHLEHAANTALALGQPLLLTGDPGTGKTQFAHHLAWQLGLGDPLEFHTKSSSAASDLFYSHDTVRRFHAAHMGQENVAEHDFVKFNALGEAILLSLCEADRVGMYGIHLADAPAEPMRSVVLIDEIDKAPRDFPNDLLHEIPNMAFRIPELNLHVKGDPQYRPVVIITSNRERPVPDAFLRRCIFHNIESPTKERMAQILCARFGYVGKGTPPFIDSVAELLITLRTKLLRPPSTAETVAWVHLLIGSGVNMAATIQQQGDKALKFLSVLAKTREDVATMRTLLTA